MCIDVCTNVFMFLCFFSFFLLCVLLYELCINKINNKWNCRHKAKQNTLKSTVLVQEHCLPRTKEMFKRFADCCK